jgi:hypothetical protein
VSEEIGTSKHVGLAEALQSRRAIICAGAGGVGKTTVSASLALAAARLGRRVLVVTIDPSRRLAETLGVSRHLAEPIALDPARLAALGVHPPGSLDAWMLDPGIVSDRTVESFAQTPDDARRLLANPVYQGLSRMTAGMQEFTAVEAMHTFVTTGALRPGGAGHAPPHATRCVSWTPRGACRRSWTGASSRPSRRRRRAAAWCDA